MIIIYITDKIEVNREEEPVKVKKELKGLTAGDLIQCESIDFKEDPVLYQKRIRDEW